MLLSTIVNSKEKLPDTSDFEIIVMVLSDAGKARWKNANDNNLEFHQFNNFEQLHPFMTYKQKKELLGLISTEKSGAYSNQHTKAYNPTFYQQSKQPIIEEASQPSIHAGKTTP